MTISKLFFLVLSLVTLSSNLTAQADCDYRLRIYLRDEVGNSIKNAKLKLSNWKEFYYRNQFDGYEAWGLRGVGAPVWKANLKVSADGFRTFKEAVNISCGKYEFFLALRPKNSKVKADFRPIIKEDNTKSN